MSDQTTPAVQTSATDTVGTTVKSRAIRFFGIATGLAIATGFLAACDGASATRDSTLKTEQSASAGPNGEISTPEVTPTAAEIPKDIQDLIDMPEADFLKLPLADSNGGQGKLQLCDYINTDLSEIALKAKEASGDPNYIYGRDVTPNSGLQDIVNTWFMSGISAYVLHDNGNLGIDKPLAHKLLACTVVNGDLSPDISTSAEYQDLIGEFDKAYARGDVFMTPEVVGKNANVLPIPTVRDDLTTTSQVGEVTIERITADESVNQWRFDLNLAVIEVNGRYVVVAVG